jgi:hypothetical protein
MPPRPPPRHLPSSAISAFVDPARIDLLLARWVPEAEDRAFVVRCLVGEGPAHHRGANFVLLSLLAQALEKAKAQPEPQGVTLPVPMRLPPHLAHAEAEQDAYPLRLPTAPLERLAPSGSRELEAMVDCLTDGPPQHALANVAMVALLGALLDALERD